MNNSTGSLVVGLANLASEATVAGSGAPRLTKIIALTQGAPDDAGILYFDQVEQYKDCDFSNETPGTAHLAEGITETAKVEFITTERDFTGPYSGLLPGASAAVSSFSLPVLAGLARITNFIRAAMANVIAPGESLSQNEATMVVYSVMTAVHQARVLLTGVEDKIAEAKSRVASAIDEITFHVLDAQRTQQQASALIEILYQHDDRSGLLASDEFSNLDDIFQEGYRQYFRGSGNDEDDLAEVLASKRRRLS